MIRINMFAACLYLSLSLSEGPKGTELPLVCPPVCLSVCLSLRLSVFSSAPVQSGGELRACTITCASAAALSQKKTWMDVKNAENQTCS